MACGSTVGRIFEDCNTINSEGLQYIKKNGCKTQSEETDMETNAWQKG